MLALAAPRPPIWSKVVFGAVPHLDPTGEIPVLLAELG